MFDMRAVLVDDEQPARDEMAYLLAMQVAMELSAH